ncbi:FxsA family protein [Streptomonospora litoralis]|uniref:Phage T7 F exclusion suppressor FxsA n=1 Tax=Streptomonospora litoralis TaxID=2498135 RepID=A0A4V0ZJP3_9ACTN|nr:FxsA family protein [Streptomonospora litoralis]QBI54182.1 phage T7 F exclusion suppressor FxsA [Streptomonospora litoralis]
MPLLIVIALMALPFLEIWLMILVGQQIGVAWTIALLFALSAAGVVVLRSAGTKTFREADAAMRTGTPPQGGLLDTLMLMVGGILLLTPGFVTAALGAVMALPFTRPALRWAFTGWAERRVKRMRDSAEAEFVAQGGRIPPQPGRQGERAPSGGRVIRGRVVEDE